MKVIFYQTVATGQEVEAVITYDGKKYACEGNKVILELLPPESAGPKVILAALEKAPAKFDGRYLRAELVIDAKGSSESGHYNHTGLPGVWGGSRPTGGAEPDGESTPEPGKARTTASAAKDIRSAAERNEPTITKIVTGVVEEYNGEMYKLDCRLKETESIQRRLEWMMNEQGRNLDGVDGAIEHLTDSVRYTMVLDDNIYVDGAKAAIKTLEDQGWSEYKNYFENYWECGFGFEGYITVFSKGDQVFELQFHTPSAIKILAKSHAIYERSRTMKEGPAKDKLVNEMQLLWDTVPSPPGWETLRGILIGREKS